MRILTLALCLTLAALQGLVFMGSPCAGPNSNVDVDILSAETFTSTAISENWEPENRTETPVILKAWPNAINWGYQEGGFSPNYAIDRWAVAGQLGYGELKNKTYIEIHYLLPGFYWEDGYTDDVRRSYWFTRNQGTLRQFADAKWESEQRFECYNRPECSFRNLKFTVENETCQWVFDNPYIGDIEAASDRWAVMIIHCGDTKPFMEEHFNRKAETIKIIYPGKNISPAPKKQKPNRQYLHMKKAMENCTNIGFTIGTQKHRNCVRKKFLN